MNDILNILSAELGAYTTEEPGNFVRTSESGIHVAAGDRREVAVTKAKYAGIDLSGHALAEFFGSHGRAA